MSLGKLWMSLGALKDESLRSKYLTKISVGCGFNATAPKSPRTPPVRCVPGGAIPLRFLSDARWARVRFISFNPRDSSRTSAAHHKGQQQGCGRIYPLVGVRVCLHLFFYTCHALLSMMPQ